jgi:Abnormal spindle-like microcephaly-assoc'd, ASPM-SPD-2-Hydin
MSIYLRDFGNRPACLCDQPTVVSLVFVLLLCCYPLHAEDQTHRALGAADSRTVTLTAAATAGSSSARVASNNAPATVTVPANAARAAFMASVSPVKPVQEETATAGNVSTSFALQLNAALKVLTLTIAPTNVEFGSVTVNTSSTVTVRLTSTGTAPVTIKSGKLTGSGFKMSGATFPVTLDPGLALTLDIQFHPAVTGAATGRLTLESNSSVNGKLVVDLTGRGESPKHQVYLSWDRPSDSIIPIVGYDIYRAVSSSSAYHRLNSSLDVHTSYVDTTIQTGVTYDYVVRSVDSFGVESAPSNKAAVAIP